MDKASRNAQIRELYNGLIEKGYDRKKSATMTREKLGLHQLSLRTIMIYASETYEINRQNAINTRLDKPIENKYFCPHEDDKGEVHGNKWVKREGSSAYCGGVRSDGKKCMYTFIGTGIK